MKTNRSARKWLKVHGIVMCLALIGLVAAAFQFGSGLSRIANKAQPVHNQVTYPNITWEFLLSTVP
jgi:hypothetical protein